MTDKERLEEMEAKYSILNITSERDGIEYTEVDVKDLVFLIQNGFKQAERVQGLEEERERYQSGRNVAVATKMKMDDLEKQNKRYREAILETLQAMGMVDRQKYGKTLERALEGTE